MLLLALELDSSAQAQKPVLAWDRFHVYLDYFFATETSAL